MVVDECQTILDIKFFITPFDLIHAAAESDGAEKARLEKIAET